jgi:gluconolactonase
MLTPHYEILTPRFRGYVLPNAALVTLGEGFAWLEGPVWFADQDCLIVSDLPNDRLMRWSESGGITEFRKPAGFPNGNTRDRLGRLITCSHQRRSLLRTELDGRVTPLATHFEGRRLNSPNDVICRSDGTLWFTDPVYGISTDYEGGKASPELPAAVYRLDPETGALDVVTDSLDGPNGLAFSPDERLLYIAESGAQFAADPDHHIRVFEVGDATGWLRGGRVLRTISPGHADGFRTDEDGNLWCGAGDGVQCIAPDGSHLGSIKLPCTVSNLTFGGRHRSRLFICASHTLFAIYTNQRGTPPSLYCTSPPSPQE